MYLGTILEQLRDEHKIAAPLCMLWTADDVRRHLPEGTEVSDDWCMRTLDDALVEQEERILEMINEIIANHIEMIKDEQ
jgi:hypothetical protein